MGKKGIREFKTRVGFKSLFDRDAHRSGPTIHFVGLETLVKIIVNSSLFVLLWIKGPLKGFQIH